MLAWANEVVVPTVPLALGDGKRRSQRLRHSFTEAVLIPNIHQWAGVRARRLIKTRSFGCPAERTLCSGVQAN
jgi:hypothetical protein